MKILIDGDACSRITTIEDIAGKKGIPCHIYCDASRIIDSEYSTVHIVDIGTNSADMAIVKHCSNGDIVITDDTGLAAMVLTMNAFAMNNSGMEFTNKNILQLLSSRHIRQDIARKTKRKQVHGSLKPNEKHASFAQTLNELVKRTAE